MPEMNRFNRRDFIGAGVSAFGLGFVAEEILADPEPLRQTQEAPGAPVGCVLVGFGVQGQEILAALGKMQAAPVVAVCDTYSAPLLVKKAKAVAPQAAFETDYRKALSMPGVQAVFVATPTHKHAQIVQDALQAGKHVYCEAPLSNTIEEAKAIARTGAAAKTVFQAGLQMRSNKMNRHILNFVRSGALGNVTGGSAQWRKRGSWRRAGATPERERDLNWRLAKATSIGLPGEIGIHQFDVYSWYLGAQPVAVTGFGGVLGYRDHGMQVADTIQCVLEYPKGVRVGYDATLTNSFDGSYESLYGTDAAMIIRDQRGWMIKEADASLLGWEVYARKDKFSVGDADYGTGIALVADATKLIAQGKKPGEIGTDLTKTALYQSLAAFLDAVRKESKPNAGALEGYQATVAAIKTHEAVSAGTRIEFQKEWFVLS